MLIHTKKIYIIMEKLQSKQKSLEDFLLLHIYLKIKCVLLPFQRKVKN